MRPRVELAVCVGMAAERQGTKVASAKAGQVKGDNMGVLITAAVVFVCGLYARFSIRSLWKSQFSVGVPNKYIFLRR